MGVLGDAELDSLRITVRKLRTTVAQLERTVADQAAALAWYGEQATALHRYMTAKPPKDQAILACVQALSLDDGRRAKYIDAALAASVSSASEDKP